MGSIVLRSTSDSEVASLALTLVERLLLLPTVATGDVVGLLSAIALVLAIGLLLLSSVALVLVALVVLLLLLVVVSRN